MNNLIISKAEKHLVLYRDMVSAISSCCRIDECKDIADKSIALAAYYRQIRDDTTVQMFNQVRLRAWRRIGELFSTVDVSNCETQIAKIKKIRSSFDPAVVGEITDSRVAEILRLMKVSDKDFEHAMADRDLTGSIPDLLTRTPQYKEMARQNREAFQPAPKDAARREQEDAANARHTSRIHRHLAELTEASNVAMKETGTTLAKKDHTKLKQIVVLIKPEIYAVMKRAASEQKLTMQEMLHCGIEMWLTKHGYTSR